MPYRRIGARPTIVELPVVGGHGGFDHEAGVLDVGLDGGVPRGLALVQVDRDCHGGQDADDDDDHEQFDEGEALLALGAWRFSALRTLFIMNPSFQLEGHTVGPSNFGWSTAILLCVISPCGGGWLT